MEFLSRFRRYPELRTVIVNLHSGTSFKGVIWRRTGPFVVIRNAELLQDRDNAARKAVDGEIAVKLSDIDFVQVL
jgi:small nuclear ribonucleoprotein (snRNP)-like protein